MYTGMKEHLTRTIGDIRSQGLYKNERIITSPQGARIGISTGTSVLNFCANNYLGLSSDLRVIKAARRAMEEWGYGLSSVRFICGTQSLHRELEMRMSEFLRTDDAILYAACFDANAGVFEPLFDAEDTIISDELNHASIIDGVRLSRARRLRYKHADMNDLARCLDEARGERFRVICTDGVFSMDGDIAKLEEICGLAEKHDALVMVDDSHGTGYLGKTGRGAIEHCGVEGRVDIITTTFGKALGGASGGCVAGRREIVEMLRQRSRPYLFSNSLPPAVAGATLEVLKILEGSSDLRARLMESAVYFKKEISAAGFEIIPGETAIVPLMLYDEKRALAMADRLLEEGVYVVGFTYPVVPKGRARIRVQISAAHTKDDLDKAIGSFIHVGRELGIV